MGAPQFEQAGADISGTGTTNTIPRWTGPSTLGDSVITQSGSFIGIGTASPGAQLHIERAGGATANAEYIRLRNTTNATGSNVSLAFYTSNNAVSTGFISHTTATGPSYDTTFSNWNGSTAAEVMRIVGSTGNVGIGTASPLGYANFVALNIGDNNAAKTGLLKFRSTYNAGNGAELYQATDGRVILNADGTGTTAAILDPTNKLLNIAPASGWGLKLPATPGNADTQTLDAYQEIGTGTPAEIALTLTCGTSGTITVNAAQSKARVTRVGNKVIGHGRIVVSSVSTPLGRLSCVLTGCPQPFTNFLVETQTDNTTGLASGNRIVGTSDTAATPTIYFDRYSPNTSSTDAAANIQAGTIIVFNICYSV